MGSLSLGGMLTGGCADAWVFFGSSLSQNLNMLMISEFAVIEHWLLLFVVTLPL